MANLNDLTATELADLLRRKECSAVEILQSCLARIQALEPQVKGFVDIDEEGALRHAEACDAGTGARGPLHGIPIAVKDTVDVAGMRCIWGTQIHRDRIPTKDAKVVRRLREAGAVILGTTVTTEYAIAKAGPTTNPHDPAFSPGGSSSGSGAVVAARMVPLSVATQSVGSIIRPSSYCGVFGLKPTLGAISTEGAMPLSGRLDHVGPMARSVADIALASSVMFEGHGISVPSALPGDTRILRIDGPLSARIEPPTAAALERAQAELERAGFIVSAVTLPERFSHLIECYETIIFHDLAHAHRGDFERHRDMISPALQRIADIGLAITPAAYDAAVADAAYFREHLLGLMDGNCVVLTPATDGSAPALSDRTGEQKLQSLWTVTGLPSLATPCGKVDGLPVGVQLVSTPGREALCLAAAGPVEAAYGHESLVTEAHGARTRATA